MAMNRQQRRKKKKAAQHKRKEQKQQKAEAFDEEISNLTSLVEEKDDVLFANVTAKLKVDAAGFFGLLHNLRELDKHETREAADALEEVAAKILTSQGANVGFQTDDDAGMFADFVEKLPSVEAKGYAISASVKRFEKSGPLTPEQTYDLMTETSAFNNVMKTTEGLNPDERWAVYKEAGRILGLRDEEPIGIDRVIDEVKKKRKGIPSEASKFHEGLENIVKEVERTAGWKEGEKVPRTVIGPGFGVKDGEISPSNEDPFSAGRMKLHKLADGKATIDDVSNQEWLREFKEVESFRSDCDEDSTQATLESYMMICSWLLEDSRKDRTTIKLGSANPCEHKQDSSAIWAKMRNARIFHFTFDQFQRIYHGADVYTTEEIAGMDWGSLGENTISKSESKHHQTIVTKIGLTWPFPEHLPFDNIFLGLGAGVPLTPTQFFLRMSMDRAKEIQIAAAKLMGYLVTVQGDVIEFMVTKNLPDTLGMYFHPKRAGAGLRVIGNFVEQPEGNWDGPYDLTPWIIGGLVQSINDHQTVIIEGEGRIARQQHWRKRAKKDFRIKHIPPPYYTVTIQARTIKEELFSKWKSDKTRTLAYQHDRRGHYRVRVARGPLPMSEKDRKKFEARAKHIGGGSEQKIFETKRLDEDTIKELNKRNVPLKRTDEWMVVLITWVDDMKVPADPEPGVPYVPSIRKVPRVKERNAGWEGKKMQSEKSASNEA